MTIFDTRQMSSNEYNITHIIQVSSTNNHSFYCIPFIYKVVHFWNILDTSWPDDCTDHRIFLPCYFFLDMICPGSCIAMTELSIYNTHLSQTNTKSFEQSLLLMRASVLKAVYYCVSVWLALNCMTVILEMRSLPLYFEDWPSILADPHCSG